MRLDPLETIHSVSLTRMPVIAGSSKGMIGGLATTEFAAMMVVMAAALVAFIIIATLFVWRMKNKDGKVRCFTKFYSTLNFNLINLIEIIRKCTSKFKFVVNCLLNLSNTIVLSLLLLMLFILVLSLLACRHILRLLLTVVVSVLHVNNIIITSNYRQIRWLNWSMSLMYQSLLRCQWICEFVSLELAIIASVVTLLLLLLPLLFPCLLLLLLLLSLLSPW